MSILSRLTSRHLDDAAFAALWTRTAAAGRTSDGGTALADPHLATCAECRLRFAAFGVWMEDIRSDARSRADEAFPPSAWPRSRPQIFRRLEAAERPARVIAFPKYPVGGGDAIRARPPLDRGRGRRRPPRRRGPRPDARLAAFASVRAASPAMSADTAAEPVRAVPPVQTLDQRGSTARSSSKPPRRRTMRRCAPTTPSPRGPPTSSSRPGNRWPHPQPLIFRKGLDMKEAVAGELLGGLRQRARRPGPRKRTTTTPPAGSPSISRASSASATASIAPSTTPTRRGGASPAATSS